MLRQVISGKPFLKQSFLRDLFLCFLSSVLLILSFPKTDFWVLTWVGLVPLLFALDGKTKIVSFFIGYITGILFFAGTLYWFVHVTLLGMMLLILYFAAYFAAFALAYYFFRKKTIIEKLFLLPSAWVILEFIRGHLFTGFGWVSLGHSQYKNLPLIQIADLTGLFGVSFLVVMVNVLLKEFIERRLSRVDLNPGRAIVYASAMVMFCLVLCLGYGSYRYLKRLKEPVDMRVAVIQVNIPQELKWEPSAWPSIMKKYLDLTQEAAKENPDLILWPETAFPGFIWEAPQLFEELKDFAAELKIPLLLGVVIQAGEDYYNSALLISRDGEVVKQHDKLHLVPFGEYIPLRNIFPFLSAVVPIGDFTPGKEYTLFPAPVKESFLGKDGFFSVLICFEDTVPEISRGFVSRGANLLVNITNDAWFQDTKAPFLHLQASVFRAIENRRPLIRAANTGVSCFIDKFGKIRKQVEGDHGKSTHVAGYAITGVALNNERTFYTKYGDVFTYLCFSGILWTIIKRRRQY